MFGEDLIGCLFTKSNWVIRETALRHLSKDMVMQLSTMSPVTDNDSTPSSPAIFTDDTDSQEPFINEGQAPPPDAHIDRVLRLSCQILAIMVGDPVYKVYVSSLVSSVIGSRLHIHVYAIVDVTYVSLM